MSNIAIDAEKTPAAAAQPSEPKTESKKAVKRTKPAAKKAKPAPAKVPAERSNKKAEVIALRKRTKGAPR